MSAAVEHVFSVMGATYGAAWDRSLGTAPINDVKTIWADALADFTHSDDAKRAIIWGLKNLPDTVPNSRQFRTLCRQAPAKAVVLLPSPTVNTEIAAKVTDGLRKTLADQPVAGRLGWAKKILANPEGRTPTVIRMAKDAMGAA